VLMLQNGWRVQKKVRTAEHLPKGLPANNDVEPKEHGEDRLENGSSKYRDGILLTNRSEKRRSQR
jgi:hypothetical protein